jgi:hypothetical protein
MRVSERPYHYAVTLLLDSDARARVLDFVRPLSVSLDGMTNFGFVERRLRVVERLLEETRALDPAAAAAVDESRLFLLAAFAGLPGKRSAAGGRAELLLQTAGVPPRDIQSLFRSLRRFEADPRSLEEELVRDAGILETVGAYGVTQTLVSASRERMTLAEMAEEIEGRMSAARFATRAARRLAEDRVAFARLFARRLREEVAEFDFSGESSESAGRR